MNNTQWGNFSGQSNNQGQGAQPGQQGGQQQAQPIQPVQPAPAPAAPAQPAYQVPPAPQAAAPAYQAPPAPPAPAPGYQAPPAPGQPAPQYPAANPGAPMAGQAGAQPGAQGAANPPGADPNYKFGEQMKSFTTTVVLPANNLQFDHDYFINLLAGSISLSKDEKKRIIDSIPKLRQAQVDELIRIFEEERTKFIELSPKHSAQLKKLEKEHMEDWRDIEMEIKSKAAAKEDESQVDDIKKQLGL